MSTRVLTKPTRMKGAKGGKGGGSSSAPKEAPNTLQSKTIVKLLDILGEGPIRGFSTPSHPEQSVILNAGSSNATPLMGADGNLNYSGATIAYRLGDPSQDLMGGFDDQVQTTQVQTPVKNQGDPIGNAVVRRINDLDTSAARVIMQIDALLSIDTSTGDQNGYSVEYAIDIKAAADQVGSSFVEKVHDRITGKTTSPWQQSYRIPLDGASPWDVRVRRLSADDSTASKQSATSWAVLEEITEYKLQYPYTAYVGLTADTSQFGTSVPSRGYLVEGLIVQVPANYDADARTYSGIWDGTFTTAYSNNPAWVLYDLLSNNRYGLGDLFTTARLSMAKWDLYAIAKYCDAYNERDGSTDDYDAVTGKHGVADGKGGFEPRFTFNGSINTKEKAYECIAAICGMMRSAMLWAGGQARFMQDRPMNAVKIFTPANVVDGTFNYTGTALRARTTAVRVLWQNPDKGWTVDDVVIEDPDAIVRYGYNLKEETAFGCTSYGQALRHARNILVTERLETDSAQFQIGHGEIDILPGQVCKISDPSMTEAEWGGRVAAHTSNTVTLDRDIEFDAARTYTFSVILADGSLADFPMTNPGGSARTITLGQDFDADNAPVPNAMWAISSDVVGMRTFRLITISNNDDATFKMAAIQYEPSKYSEIETGLKAAPAIYSDLPPTDQVQPPSNLRLNYSSVKTSTGTNGVLEIEWDRSNDLYLNGYLVEYQYGFDNWVRLPVQADVTARLINPKLGPVRVRVSAINVGGLASQAITTDLDLSTGTATDKGLISDLQVVGGGTQWTGRDLNLQWSAKPSYGDGDLQTDGRDPFFKSFRVEIRDATTHAVLADYYPTDTKFALTYDQMVNFGVRRTLEVGVALVDVNGGVSDELAVNFTNPPPAIPAVTVVPGKGSFQLKFTPPSDPDYAGIKVWASSTSGFTANDATLVYNDRGNPMIAAQAGTTVYFKYAFYDDFGMTGVSISAEQSVYVPTLTVADFDTTPPAVPTLPANPLTSTIVNDPVTGQPIVRLTFSWNAVADADKAGYQIEFKEGAGGWIGGYSTGADQTSITITVPANTSYSAHVRAYDKLGNMSGFSTTAGPYTTAKDTTPPAAPTGLVALGKIGGSFLSWTNPSDLDVAHVEVYENTTNASGSATLIATVNAAPGLAGGYSRVGVSAGGLRYYWLKSVDQSGNKSGFSTVVSVTIPQAVAADIADGSLVASKLADATITAQKIAAGLSFVENFTGSLPTTGNYEGRTGTLSGKLYRYTGGAWTAAVAASDISGTLQDAQIAALAASKITGQLTDSQIAQLAASKVSGQLTDSQLAAISAAKVTGQLVDSQLAALSATKLTGTLTDAQLSAISAAKVTGQITGTQITDHAISTAKLAAGAVTAAQIAANTITAAQIAAGTLTATELASKSITVDKLVVTATGSVNADPYFEDATAWSQGVNYGTKTITDGLRGSNVVYTKNQYSTVIAPTSALRPIDPTKNYTIECVMRRLSGTGVFYGMLRFYDVNMSQINMTDGGGYGWPNNGANAYWPSGYQPPDTNWQTLTVQFGPDYPMKVPPNAAYVLVGFLLNYNVAETCETQVNEYRVRPMVAGELMVDGTITGLKIAAGTVTATNIAASTITTAQIAASTILGTNIHAGTITGSHLVANTITAAQIAANTITAAQIAAGTITAAQIASATITGDKLVANTITASQIAVGTISPTLLYNGYGQTGNTDGWAAIQTTGNPTTLASLVGAYDIGSTSLRLTKTSTSDGAGWSPKPVAVTPGKQYNIRVTLNGSVATASGLYIRVFSGASSVNNYSGNMVELVPGSSPIPPSKTTYNATWTCPATDSWAQIAIYNWVGGPLQMALVAEMTEMVSGVLIQSGAVTADKIAANTITAAQIAAGTITGDLIAAHQITAEKLTIAPSNLIENSEFSTGDLTGWRPWANTQMQSVIPANTGWPAPHVCQFYNNAGTTNSISAFAASSAYSDANADFGGFGVIAGEQYAVSVTAAYSAVAAPEFIVYAYFHFNDGSLSPVSVIDVAPTGSATKYTGSFTVPANAYRCWLYVYGPNMPGGSVIFFTALRCWKMASADLIVDGAITANKIAANTITAAQIASATITATQIATGTITAAQIAANTITGDKINSATSLPATLTIGTTGFSLETVRAQAMNTSVVNLYDVLYQSNGTVCYTITGNTVTKALAGNNWTANAYSREYYTGAAVVSFKTTYAKHAMVGLTDSPTYQATGSEYNLLDYAIYVTAGSLAIYESGVAVASGITGYSDATQYQVVYDGATVKYYADGNLLRSVATTANRKFYFGTSIYEQGNAVTNIQFGPGNDNSLANTDPAARINAYTTQINPGQILVSGSTTLANWRNGSDATKIEGGSIAANTIKANSLTIGNRNVTFLDIVFSVNAAGTTLSWTGGYAQWTNSAGGLVQVTIAAGSTSTNSRNYVYWTEGATSLSVASSPPSYDAAICLCCWIYGNRFFVNNFGGTIIDGTRITTGTITAAQIAANTITASQIASGTITGDRIAAGTITADKLTIGSASGARLALSFNLIQVFDANGIDRVSIGIF